MNAVSSLRIPREWERERERERATDDRFTENSTARRWLKRFTYMYVCVELYVPTSLKFALSLFSPAALDQSGVLDAGNAIQLYPNWWLCAHKPTNNIHVHTYTRELLLERLLWDLTTTPLLLQLPFQSCVMCVVRIQLAKNPLLACFCPLHCAWAGRPAWRCRIECESPSLKQSKTTTTM